MSVCKRGLTVLAILGPAFLAHASINYSNIVATVTFEDNTTENLTVVQGSNSLDIFASGTPMSVGQGTNHTSAVVDVSYDASSTTSINQIGLLFTGFTSGTGTINYDEKVFDSGGVNLLSEASGTKSNNNAFVQNDTLSFSGTDAIHVEKTFTLDLGNQPGIFVGNFASVGLIEQNAVPEPASMTALAIGGLGLLARRRRRR